MIEINPYELQQVLSRLLELFAAETALLNETVPSQDLLTFHTEKTDLLNYLEWNRIAIIAYMQSNKEGNDNLEKNEDKKEQNKIKDDRVEEPKGEAESIHEKIGTLIKEVHLAAEQHMKLIAQKKYLNEKFIELVQDSVNNIEKGTAHRYGPKGKKSSISVYGKQTPHVVYNEDA